jgi:hypothetical protein
LEDAGIELKSDRVKTTAWLETKAGLRGSSVATSGASNVSKMAVEAFESAGTVVSAEAVAALDREIVRTERGAATAHCTSISCTGALYLGKARLEPESIEWLERARASIDEGGL